MIRLSLLVIAAAGCMLAQTATVVTNGAADPPQIRIGVATKVRFTADIGVANLIAGSVNLQRLGATGTNPIIVGTLLDDGTGGDEIAGDGRYSLEVTLNEPAAANVTFLISAAIRGQIVRAKSDNIVVPVLANRPPVAIAGPARAGRTGTAILLDGRRSYDLDGDLLSFSWSLTSRPTGSAAALDNSTFVKPSFTPDVAGTYKATLIVNDGIASSIGNDVLIQVSSTNAAPTAVIAGTLQLPFGGGATASNILNGTASFDPEAAALTYTWRLVTKPASSTAPVLSPLSSVTPTLTADKPGRYVVELIVNDGVNASAPVQATVIFYTPRTPPVVSAGPDQTQTTAALVNLTGTAAAGDNGITIASVAWAFIARPAGSTATLQNAGSLTPSFTPDVNGDYLLELTATDSRGIANRARVVIRRAAPVTVPVNQPPTVSAGAAQTIILPATANLLATASDDGLPNPPGALSITWIAVSGPTAVTFSSPATLATTATFYSTGTFVLRVTANDGALSTSSDVTITVNDSGPKLPFIQDRTISLGSRYQARLSADDANVTAALTFSLDAAPAGAGFNPNPTIDWTPTAAQVGTNSFTARVTDSLGRFDTKTFHVIVTSANRPPVLAAQADASLAVGSQFTRTLTATDPDAGDTMTFGLVSGPAGMTLTGAALNWTATGAGYAMFPVVVKVTDHAGAIDAKKFVLTLLPSAPPIATDDAYTVILGQTLTTTAPTGVLANDISPLGSALTATKLTDPSKGTLSAFAADGSFTYQAPPTLPGPVFTPLVKTDVATPADGVIISNPLVADLDGDGKAEIIVQNGGGGQIVAYHQDGSVLWKVKGRLPAPNADCYPTPLSAFPYAVGDVDDDGKPEIVLAVYCTRDSLQAPGLSATRWAALRGLDGSLKWLSPVISALSVPTGPNYSQPTLSSYAQPTIARLRATESPSILLPVDASGVATVGIDNGGNPITGPACKQIVATVPDGTFHYPDPGSPGHYYACRGVFVLNGSDGTIRQSMIVARGSLGDIGYENVGNPAVIGADLNQDGSPEIISGSVVYNVDGTVRSQRGDTQTTETALGNFDDTPDIEVVRYEHTANNDAVTVYKADGSVLWSVPFSVQTVVSKLTVADIDNSGRPSVVLSLYSNVCAIDYRGNVKWCYNTGAVGGVIKVRSRNRHTVFDIDGDGVPEVIVSATEKILFLDGVTGTLKYSFDIPSTLGVTGVDGNALSAAPVISDTDGTGHAKLVFGWNEQFNGSSQPGHITILKNQGDTWRPARQIMNQAAFFGANINDNGTIPALPLVNNFATPATNLFAAPQQLGTPVDPKLRTQTSFTYMANAGGLSSSPATATITILPVSRPPVFTSTPPTRFSIYQPFTYTARAISPNIGDTVHYDLSYYYSYSTCSIDSVSGVVTCNQPGYQVGQVAEITVLAINSQGQTAFQTISMVGVTGSAVVPNVLGLTQAAAQTSVTSSGFTVGSIVQTFSGAPAGQVTGQLPAGGTTQLSGEVVSLTVSKGPAPVAVPFVTGQALTTANTSLSGAGFTSNVTRVFSNTVPNNTVISQAPAAGTLLAPVAGNPVALTVSSGNGLQLRLNRALVTADQTITITPLAFDVNGNATTVPALTYSVAAALTPFPGTLPVVSGTTITPGLTTVGSFTLTATDAVGGRSATIAFAVVLPRTPGKSSNGASFATFEETLESMYALRDPLKAARAANDVPQMQLLLKQMIALWRTVDMDDLKLSLPISPSTGFVPRVEDLTALGLSATPQDLLIHQILVDACNDMQALTDGLKAQGTSIAQLQALTDQFSTRAARLDGLTVTEFGAVYNQVEYRRLLSRKIPAFFEALMEEIAQLTSVGRRQPTFPRFAKTPVAESTLAEVATTIAVDLIVDKIMDSLSPTYKNAKDLVIAIHAQTAWAGAALVIRGYLQNTYPGQDLEAVISGASYSFQVFSFAPAIIETETTAEDPQLSNVFVIGPDPVFSVLNGAKALKDAASYGLDAVTNPKRAKNLDEVKDLISKLKGGISTALSAANGNLAASNILANALQTPDNALPGCIFTSNRFCNQLIFTYGISPVYRYSAPSLYSGLPVPIVFVVQNDRGDLFFGTPAFFPAPALP